MIVHRCSEFFRFRAGVCRFDDLPEDISLVQGKLDMMFKSADSMVERSMYCSLRHS